MKNRFFTRYLSVNSVIHTVQKLYLVVSLSTKLLEKPFDFCTAEVELYHKLWLENGKVYAWCRCPAGSME